MFLTIKQCTYASIGFFNVILQDPDQIRVENMEIFEKYTELQQLLQEVTKFLQKVFPILKRCQLLRLFTQKKQYFYKRIKWKVLMIMLTAI